MKWSVELFWLNKMSGLKSYREKFYDYLFDTKDNDKEEIIAFLEEIAEKLNDYKTKFHSATSKLNCEKHKIKQEIIKEKKDEIFKEAKKEIELQIRSENMTKIREADNKMWQASIRINNSNKFLLDTLHKQEEQIIDNLEQEWLRVSTDEKFDIDEERTRGYLIAIRKAKKTIKESYKQLINSIDESFEKYIQDISENNNVDESLLKWRNK